MKKTNKQIVCSFSGGETSAYMAIRLKQEYPDTKFVFANTGQENEETLEFVDAVDKFWGLGVVWIEAITHADEGVGVTYNEVCFESASRNGEPFEAMIKKYGLHGVGRPLCTDRLKTVPITKFAKEKFGDCLMAIGIRVDEIDRVNANYKSKNLCYPLAFWWPKTKNDINTFWRDQSFRLNLKHYEGNCKTCYKKSFKKLAWIMKKNPEKFVFVERMEREHSMTKNDTGKPFFIYRGHRTVADIREMAKTATEPVDDARIYEVNNDLFGYDEMEMDWDACGSESCEAF